MAKRFAVVFLLALIVFGPIALFSVRWDKQAWLPWSAAHAQKALINDAIRRLPPDARFLTAVTVGRSVCGKVRLTDEEDPVRHFFTDEAGAHIRPPHAAPKIERCAFDFDYAVSCWGDLPTAMNPCDENQNLD